MTSSNYKVLVFDLDDTLLNTTQILIPLTLHRTCEAMIQAGLECSIQECVQTRQTLMTRYSRHELFAELVTHINQKPNPHIADIGFQIFYNPSIPDSLPLMPGAEELLQWLNSRYSLFLLTAGVPETQKKKIKSLGIEKFFKQIYLSDIQKNESKKNYLQKILQQENIYPQNLLSIGNSYSDEIEAALSLNCHACWIPYGEQSAARPDLPPTFICQSLKQLPEVCHL